jgi:transcriptional regulator with XRE-family HTH domain
MPTTAEQLGQKNREGLSLLIRFLAKLGVSSKEIAEKLGVSPPLISAWVHSKRRMTPDDQDWLYTTFVDAIMTRWPDNDEPQQRRLIPLMEALVAVWREANALETALNDEELNALMDAYRHLQKQQVLCVEDCYRVETAQGNFQALAQAQYEHKLTRQAWDMAQETIDRVGKILGPAPAQPQPTRPRKRGLRRPGQRRPRTRDHASS